jgi:hypothetical protein
MFVCCQAMWIIKKKLVDVSPNNEKTDDQMKRGYDTYALSQYIQST